LALEATVPVQYGVGPQHGIVAEQGSPPQVTL
jgi:hypothetical protein